jgi:hypothetical protein
MFDVPERCDHARGRYKYFALFMNVLNRMKNASCWERMMEAIIHASTHSSLGIGASSPPRYEEDWNSQQGLKTLDET